jgi:hypothetical protein
MIATVVLDPRPYSRTTQSQEESSYRNETDFASGVNRYWLDGLSGLMVGSGLLVEDIDRRESTTRIMKWVW